MGTAAKTIPFRFHKLRKVRMVIPWAAAVVLALYAKSTITGFYIGIPLMLIGESIRIWSHGYLRKGRKLATDGPYSYVRNPLYLGNFFIGAGVCAILWHPAVGAAFLAGFYGLYWITIKGEEQRLQARFESAYINYMKQVPKLIPSLTPYRPYRKEAHRKFMVHRVWGHGEHITILAIMVCLAGLYLRHVLYVGHGHLNAVTGILLFAAFVMSIVLVALTLARRFQKLSSNRKKKVIARIWP